MRVTQKGSVTVGIIVAILAISFTVWYVFFKAESKPVSEVPSPNVTPAVMTEVSVPAESEVVSAIQDSPYRVIKIYQSDLYKNIIYVATERSPAGCGDANNPVRCADDSACGSEYSTPTCYFFTEPKYEVGANAEVQYIGALKKAGSLDLDSLEMQDDRYLYFSTFEADAGVGFNADYQLDLQTKKFKLLKKTEFHAEM